MNPSQARLRMKYFEGSPRKGSSKGPVIAAVLIGVVVVGIAAWFAFGGRMIDSFRPHATLGQYHQIQNGMTREEVVKIMGSPGDAMASFSFGDVTAEALRWENSEESVLVVGFTQGRVVAKSQAGLH